MTIFDLIPPVPEAWLALRPRVIVEEGRTRTADQIDEERLIAQRQSERRSWLRFQSRQETARKEKSRSHKKVLSAEVERRVRDES